MRGRKKNEPSFNSRRANEMQKKRKGKKERKKTMIRGLRRYDRCADMSANSRKPRLHRSARLYLTCRAHSGRGLSTEIISFLRSRRKRPGGAGGEKRKQLADKIKNCVVFFPTPSQNDTRQNHNGSSCHGIKLNYVYSCGGASFRAHSWRSARNFLREIFSVKEKFKAWHFFLVVVRVIIFSFFLAKRHPGVDCCLCRFLFSPASLPPRAGWEWEEAWAEPNPFPELVLSSP